jgi:hypothetical protein
MKSSIIAVCSAVLLALLMWTAASQSESHPLQPSAMARSEWESAHFIFESRRPDLAVERLREYVEKDAALRERARVWRCILLAGMSRAYLELAVLFKEGARQNPERASLFHARAREFQGLARQYSRDLAELMDSRDHWLTSQKNVLLDFGMPDAAADSSLTLVSVAQGNWPGEHQADTATQSAVIRAILEETMKVTGARSAAELRVQLSRRPLSVPKADFLAALRVPDDPL